jgi:hypothetical protein
MSCLEGMSNLPMSFQLRSIFVGGENHLMSHWQRESHILLMEICLPIHDRRLSMPHTVPRDNAPAYSYLSDDLPTHASCIRLHSTAESNA